MPKLAAGVDAVFMDGKRYLPGENVNLSAEKLDELRAGGAIFEGDKPRSQVVLVSTQQNPIPTDLAGNSLLAEHKDLVKSNRDAAVAQQAALDEAAVSAAAVPAAPTAATAGGSK